MARAGDVSSGATRVTIKHLARAVGISPSAVSMALSDHPRISAGTRAEVRKVAAEMGYVASTAARSLKGQRAGSVALVVPNTGRHVFGHAYFMQLLVGVSSVVDPLGFTVTISTSPDVEHGVAAYERVLRSGAVDGAIITSAAAEDPQLARMVASGLPVVLLGSYPNLAEATKVCIDDQPASRELTEHFIREHGARTFGYISGPMDHQSAIDRYAGFTEALAGRTDTRHVLVEGDYSEESGRAAAAEILATGGKSGIETIVAANDEMAFGALTAVREHGLDTPSDIRLAGFDDFGLARVTSPALTTVAVPAEELGARATELLLRLMDGHAEEPRHTVLPTRLVLRTSCGCRSPQS